MQSPNVLLIYTGGTIGMVNDPETGALIPFNFEHLYENVPELRQFDYTINVASIDEPIDSSEMQPSNWAAIAKTIFDKYTHYDGFVILHGSDTMAYTASALSYMLQGIRKPIILTGSQLPIGQIRTDGKENLITAVEIAGMKDLDGNAILQEVAIYFEYRLYRGNRTSKVSANHFEAFQSGNYPNLAEAGVNIFFQPEYLFRTELSAPTLVTEMDNAVAVIRLFPGINIEHYASIFESTKGIVIESFGAGNAPSNKSLEKALSDYTAKGGLLLNVTQCSSGSVSLGKYETNEIFTRVGAVNGKDLTTEAAVTKLMFVLAQNIDIELKKEILEKNLCGELSG
ncbi:MAG: asparaginase [Crocinitomicaceae bacterium]|nr:asparaginase [Crocinitomicaceae bacterium]